MENQHTTHNIHGKLNSQLKHVAFFQQSFRNLFHFPITSLLSQKPPLQSFPSNQAFFLSNQTSQRNPMMMAKELPEDLVTQILLWLPVVSLLRFKCVCKSWYALITHQNFIRKHLLHNNNNKNSNTLLLLKNIEDYGVSTFSYETLQVSLTQPVPPHSFWIEKKGHISIVGSCNGLVCLHRHSRDDQFNVVIWNPATKETKVVPKSNRPRIPAGYRTSIDGMGFGFDAKTNDYKIINLLRYSSYFENEVIYQKEIYSLSADSWRKVDGPPCFLSGSTYINGIASWEAYFDVQETFVLSFDMSDEVFLKTPLPDHVIRDDSWRAFFVLNESIAMAVWIYDEKGTVICFDIWLLLEVGVKDSWTKLFTIGPFTGIEKPFGFWKNETIFLEKYDGQLVLYDPSTKEMTNLQIGDGDRFSWQMVGYMETLVSVKGEKEEQESC